MKYDFTTRVVAFIRSVLY